MTVTTAICADAWSTSKSFAVSKVALLDGPLNFAENQFLNTLANLSINPEKVDSVVSAHYVAAKAEAAKRLQKLKGEEAAELEDELTLQELIADATDLAWRPIISAQGNLSDKVDEVLSGAESYVEKVLPAEEGDEEAATAHETRISRATSLGSVASRRFKKKAFAKLAGITLKLRESESPIVHLDLMRYSELLDMTAIRDRLNAVPGQLKHASPETYSVVEGIVVKGALYADVLGQELIKAKGELAAKADTRVFTPAKEFYVVAAAEFIKRAKSAEDLLKLGQEELSTRRINANEFTKKYVASVRAALGEAWDERLVKPTGQFLEYARAAYANLQKHYEEGKNSVSTHAPDGTPYTIEKGLEALVAALRERLTTEWETRVKPTLESMRKATGKASA